MGQRGIVHQEREREREIDGMGGIGAPAEQEPPIPTTAVKQQRDVHGVQEGLGRQDGLPEERLHRAQVPAFVVGQVLAELAAQHVPEAEHKRKGVPRQNLVGYRTNHETACTATCV